MYPRRSISSSAWSNAPKNSVRQINGLFHPYPVAEGRRWRCVPQNHIRIGQMHGIFAPEVQKSVLVVHIVLRLCVHIKQIKRPKVFDLFIVVWPLDG